jgi:hypothetical protein
MNAIVPAGSGPSLPLVNIRRSVLQGEQLKCVDDRWFLRSNPRENLNGSQYWAVLTVTFLQHWEGGKPVETVLPENGMLPDVDELNAQIPRERWEPGLNGEPRAPWQVQYAAYLLDPLGGIFTYINSTYGAQMAVEQLEEKTQRVRALRGAAVVPLVELAIKVMPTKFGDKPRPDFKVLDWRDLSQPQTQPKALEAPAPAAAVTTPKPVELPGKAVKPISTREEFNDDIPF